MGKVRKLNLMFGIMLIALCYTNTLYSSPITTTATIWSSNFRPHGGYVDEILFQIYSELEIPLAMLALQTGDIDAYDKRVPIDFLAALIRDENIEVEFAPSVRYRALTLNCAMFPTNITGFRRAMAYGMDKYRANMEVIGGAGQPLDSYIPTIATEWEVESQLTEHFYDADYIAGNRSLMNAGFIDLDADGWREYDNNHNGVWDEGIDIDDNDPLLTIEFWWVPNYEVARVTCEIAAEGLQSMGIRAILQEYLGPSPPVWSDLPVACWTEGVPIVNTPRFLYDNWRTGAKCNKEPTNYYHFSNATIDAYLDTMINAVTLDEEKAAAKEALRLLTYEQPQIAVYNDINIGAYRRDEFEGFQNFNGKGIAFGENPYFCTKVHLKGDILTDQFGGTFDYCLSGNMGTLNPYLQRYAHEATVFQYIYEKLWNIDPITWDPIPGLAYSWEIEQTTANGDIRDGQKFTFYLYENETWHDGAPFTAFDVNHSLHLWRDSPYHGPEMWDIYNVGIPDDHTIEFYVNETGYFKWADVTAFYITPEHIWNTITDVSSYTPTIDDVIGTGPYYMADRVPGEYISLRRHQDWRWDIKDSTNDPPVSTECYTTHTKTISRVTTPETSIKTPQTFTKTHEPTITVTTTITSSSGLTSFMIFVSLLGLILIKKSKRK